MREQPPRWGRPPEAGTGATFEVTHVLRDLADPRIDPVASYAVTARYVALRLVLEATGMDADRIAALEEHRVAAAAYVAWPGVGDEERLVLGSLVRLASPRPRQAILPALLTAAGLAAERDQLHGARTLLLAGHDLAVAEGWTADAVLAADALAALAFRACDEDSFHHWSARAALLRRRAERITAGPPPDTVA